MKAGSMNALIGASTNAKLTDVPMRAYREAELKGDKAGMERAMGYAKDFTAKSIKYSKEADAELAKEQREEAKEQEAKREKAIEKARNERKIERKKAMEKAEKDNIEANAAKNPNDTVEISDESKVQLSEQISSGGVIVPAQNDTAEIYTSGADVKPLEQSSQSAVIDVKV